MLYATGLSDDDFNKPQVGISSVWYEGNPKISGMKFGPDGRLYCASQGDVGAQGNVPKKIVAIDPATKAVTEIANTVTPNDLVDPYAPCDWLNGPEIPRLLFNPPDPSKPQSSAISGGGRGAWIVTHYEDIERVYTDNEHF